MAASRGVVTKLLGRQLYRVQGGRSSSPSLVNLSQRTGYYALTRTELDWYADCAAAIAASEIIKARAKRHLLDLTRADEACAAGRQGGRGTDGSQADLI